MKKLLAACIFLCTGFTANAQTLTLTGPTVCTDVFVDSYRPTTDLSTQGEINAYAWTVNSTTAYARSYIRFDMSALPAGAIIQSATLYLYHKAAPVFANPAGHSGANGLYIRRVTAAWSQTTTTWNNQPATTTTNEVSVPASTSATQNYEVNITQLVNDMRTSGNYGIKFGLQDETIYKNTTFCSTEDADVTKRPKLAIIYTTPMVSLLKPNGGEKTVKGSTYPILWSSAGIQTVSLYYSSNNGASWNFIANRPALSGIYSWSVPNIVSASCKVRISDSSNASTGDTSNAVFAIVDPPVLALTSPNGGEVWLNDGTHPITWTASNSDNVMIQYSTNDTAWYQVSSSVSSSGGFYSWLPSGIVSNRVRVRISDKTFPTYADMSDNWFTLRNAPAITVNTPNGGEVWTNTVAHAVAWTATASDTVTIAYSTNDSIWNTIATVASGTSPYSWMPSGIVSGTVKIRITDKTYSSYLDVSNAVFTVRAAPSVTVTAPNGAEIWLNNAPQFVTWSAVNSDSVRIEYSTNDSTWNLIKGSVASGSSSYAWIPSGIVSDHVRVRVSDKALPVYSDISNAWFTVRNAPSVTLTSPNGGEVWLNNSAHPITWTASYSDSIAIEYSTNDSTWNTITASVASGSSPYAWVPAGIISNHVRVRVRDLTYPTYGDMSSAWFTLRNAPSITLTSPNGGESWFRNSTHAITWASTGSDSVKIEYTLDSVWIMLAVSAPAGSGSYSWTLPNVLSATARVRVTDLTYPSYADVSDSNFAIIAATGIGSISDKSLFTVFPNPSVSGIFIMEADVLHDHIVIVNSLGSSVHFKRHINPDGTLALDLSEAPAGVYFMKVKDTNGYATQRLVIGNR